MPLPVASCPMSATAADPRRWTQGWRRLLLATGMLTYPALAAAGVARNAAGASAVAGYLIVVAFCCCYGLAVMSAVRLAWSRFWTLLAAMAVLFLATLPFAQVDAFFLGAVVVSLFAAHTRRYAVPVVLCAALAAVAVPWSGGPGWIQALMIVFTVLVVYAFVQTMRANHALLEARTEIARLASEAERARIARDLHDLLGHSLTAITVKSGLARRLAAAESSPSLQEISQVESLARQALAEVRAVVSGYRDVTLAGELARGRELLRASGVAADLPAATDVDATHQELFGWAVREGLTNVVRHARATRCTVTLSPAAVEICDDGVGGAAPDGNGLAGLRERVAAAGGTVEAGPLEPRGWRLRVSVDATAGRPA